ncbi:MAG: hypothetical protein ABUK01_07705 [Leptospirales bacterium]
MEKHSETNDQLAKITDAGLFERLATAILRKAKPGLYESLTHPGMNTEGKTKTSPVDNFSIIDHRDTKMIIVIHHASGKAEDLRKKWLLNPTKVKQRKGSKTKPIPGDVIKSIEVIKNIRKDNPKYYATLVLTTNKEPTHELLVEVNQILKDNSIFNDIWSCSRLADRLDNSPDGQWLRSKYLGINQQRLNHDLLQEISRESINNFNTIPIDTLISRGIDKALTNNIVRPITFILGESGVGKTEAAKKYLFDYISNDGFGLVLYTDYFESGITFEQAIDIELHKLKPELEIHAGKTALNLSSPDKPLVCIIEDINRSTQGNRILDRLISWLPFKEGRNDKIEPLNWQLICPIWPTNIDLLSENRRKQIKSFILPLTIFNIKEARAAIVKKYKLINKKISILDADKLANSLGNDPLLIGLWEPDKNKIENIIKDYLDSSIGKTTISGSFTYDEYKTTLILLCYKMLLNHNLSPKFLDLKNWFPGPSEEVTIIRELAKAKDLISLRKESESEILVFRHDRIRNNLLAETIYSSLITDSIDEDILKEPYYAEPIGIAITRDNISDNIVSEVRSKNQLALFYALKYMSSNEELNKIIIRYIKDFLKEEKTHSDNFMNLRWSALRILSEIEKDEIAAITLLFKDFGNYNLFALFRNGRLDAGVRLCRRIEPGSIAPWRDRQIEHAKIRFGDQLTIALSDYLSKADITDDARIGSLRLAGFIADERLSASIYDCWQNDVNRTQHLADYLWAVGRCYLQDSKQILDEICSEWEQLPDKSDQQTQSVRAAVGEYNISWAFGRYVPSDHFIKYFINKAQESELHWPITLMLRNTDHPLTFEYLVNVFADADRKPGSFWSFKSSILDHWRRKYEKGIGYSKVSRDKLLSLWYDDKQEDFIRKNSFYLWAIKTDMNDIDVLIEKSKDTVLTDSILAERLKLNDQLAEPQLIEKLLTGKVEFWLRYCKYIWSDKIAETLTNYITDKQTIIQLQKNPSSNLNYAVSDLLMRLDIEYVEQLLIANWQNLKQNHLFIQCALYMSTTKLKELVDIEIKKHKNPKVFFKYIGMHWGIDMSGMPGIQNQSQLESLIPYLDYIDPSDIHSIWNCCNKNKWYEFRNKIFDNRIDNDWRKQAILNEDDFFYGLDDNLRYHHTAFIDHKIEKLLEQGISIKQIIQYTSNWLKSRKTIEALRLVSAIVEEIGTRQDFKILNIEGIEPAEEAIQIRENTKFALYRNSLI